ncbi:MAG: molybdate ABC transporter permease subunit, partial [Intestinibacter sp.]
MNAGLTPLWISLRTSLLATVITFFTGIVTAYLVANYKGKWRGLIDSVFTLPLVLPPTVLGFFLLIFFGKNGVAGKFLMNFDINIIFTWTATVIAAVVVAFPMMYRSARSAFEQIDDNLIAAAKTLGMSNFKIFYKIAVPLAWPGIIGGVVLSFARAL